LGSAGFLQFFQLSNKRTGGARSELYETLERLGIIAAPGSESLGRIDYAVEVLAPDPILDPQCFVMHSNACRPDHVEHPEITINGRSGRVTSVTVGKMPGRQAIVYDKRAEVIAKGKVGWWAIWDALRVISGSPPLNREVEAESRVWRVELRAGKRHLKDRWGIRTWADLDARLGALVAATLDAIRNTRPSEDSNRSRWPISELWALVHNEAENNLFEMRSGVDPNLVKLVQKAAYDKLLAGQMTGLLVSRAALNGLETGELPAFASSVGTEMAEFIANSPVRFERKFALASGRYSLGSPPQRGDSHADVAAGL
jgi:hypothetical protein